MHTKNTRGIVCYFAALLLQGCLITGDQTLFNKAVLMLFGYGTSFAVATLFVIGSLHFYANRRPGWNLAMSNIGAVMMLFSVCGAFDLFSRPGGVVGLLLGAMNKEYCGPIVGSMFLYAFFFTGYCLLCNALPSEIWQHWLHTFNMPDMEIPLPILPDPDSEGETLSLPVSPVEEDEDDNDNTPSSSRNVSASLQRQARLIEKTLADFSYSARVSEATEGPTVTKFYLQVAQATNVAKIAQYEEQLAYALKASSIRVELPVPGQRAIGIEIPSNKRRTVNFASCTADKAFSQSTSALPLILGAGVAGDTKIADLAKMPHMLIGGQTGGGKSVLLNVLIASLLQKHNPETLRLILIDPKQVEFSAWSSLPHLAIPVITDVVLAESVFTTLCKEMDTRYTLFKEAGVRDIAAFNKRKGMEPLPYIVTIIDEMADLIETSGKGIEGSLKRLGQLARAAGMHLICATQKPVVSVLPTTLKGNLPARIALKVRTGKESEVILDAIGAENLLGNGDMLYAPGDSAELIRIQSPYLSDSEISAIVRQYRDQEPAYMLELETQDVPPANDDETLYKDVLAMASQDKRISTNSIQSHFRIGNARASRMMKRLEEEGVVTRARGALPRRVTGEINV